MPEAMKALLLFPFLLAVAAAEVPQKVALTRYIQLWSDSPFTRKPTIEQEKESTPLDDYALGGVSPVEGGYFVILLNKKKPDERIVIQPGQPSEFRVVEVRKGDTGPLATTVVVGAGGKTKALGFDEKLLTLKAAAAGGKPQTGQPLAAGAQPQPQPGQAQPAVQQPGGAGRGPANQGQGGGQPNRPPRPRVIPPSQR
jgi:hypothetical protein